MFYIIISLNIFQPHSFYPLLLGLQGHNSFFYSPRLSWDIFCLSFAWFNFSLFFRLVASIVLFVYLFIYFLIQQALISHQFYTLQCIHVNPNRPIQHRINLPCEKHPQCTRRKEYIFITRGGEYGGHEICTNLIKPILIFLITSSHLLPQPRILSLLHKCIVSLFKKYISFLPWSLLWVFILLWRLPYTYKNLIRFVCFSPVNLSLSI